MTWHSKPQIRENLQADQQSLVCFVDGDLGVRCGRSKRGKTHSTSAPDSCARTTMSGNSRDAPTPSSSGLSYPSTAASSSGTSAPASSRPSSASAPAIQQQRLYVGNLAHTVDEYTLLQVFSKYGKVTKLDFLFHKAGPMKGKPRGYAFVEYGAKEARAFPLVEGSCF